MSRVDRNGDPADWPLVPDFEGWKRAFDSVAEAEGLLAGMRRVWGTDQGQRVMRNPQAGIVETVETTEL